MEASSLDDDVPGLVYTDIFLYGLLLLMLIVWVVSAS